MNWAIDKYSRILVLDTSEEITLRGDDDQGTGFFLGLGEDIPGDLVEITKKYLGLLWSARQAKIDQGLGTLITIYK